MDRSPASRRGDADAWRTVMARLADVIIVRSFLRPIPARRLGLEVFHLGDERG